MKEGSANGASLSTGALQGKLGGRAPSLGGPEGYKKEVSGHGHLSPQGPQWGTWRGGSFTGDFERQKRGLRKHSISLSLYGALQGDPGGRAPLLGGPEGYINKSLDMGISLYRGPNGEPGGEVHLPGTLRDRKEGSGNTASLSIRLYKGNLEEGLFYWGP